MDVMDKAHHSLTNPTVSHSGPRFWAKVLALSRIYALPKSNRGHSIPDQEVSNSDQLLPSAWAIMIPETSTSSLSFRSS